MQSQLGSMLCMDSIFKFMSDQSCLDLIKEKKNRSRNGQDFERAVINEFEGQSILADWGN